MDPSRHGALGGGNNNLLIHTDWSERHYERQGILEETFVHEAAHTSLDARHAQSAEWLQAQEADCHFTSTTPKTIPYVRISPKVICRTLRFAIVLTDLRP